MMRIFLHGLDSSGNGTKGRYLQERYDDIIAPDFHGSLEKRLQALDIICQGEDSLILVGSSFGGLMATCFAIENPNRVKKLVLMAPALNFPGFLVPREKVAIPAFILMGEHDDVTPPAEVIPIARETFVEPIISVVDEDHLLHANFPTLDWDNLLNSNKFQTSPE